jgi:hypothetical protein
MWGTSWRRTGANVSFVGGWLIIRVNPGADVADSAFCILGYYTAPGYRASDALANRKGRNGQAVC